MSWAYFQGPSFTAHGANGDISAYYVGKWLCPATDSLKRSRRALICENLVDFSRRYKPRTVCFYRQFALGDVIMLLPIIRLFRRTVGLKSPVLLVTQSGIYNALVEMEKCDDWTLRRNAGRRDYGCDVHVNLDECLQADHRGGPESDFHRLELYARHLGLG